MDTIFAVATASGRAGVAVVRVSGPRSVAAAKRLCGSLPSSRGVRKVMDSNGEVIDEALILTFAGTASFTGEPTVEFQLHGSPAVVATVLDLLGQQDGLRQAEAGEFTKRALENGKLDLAQVEGLADLIDAETEAQRKQAMRVFDGALGDKAEVWRKRLIRAAALLEATIDFVDEEVPTNVYPEVLDLIENCRGEIKSEIAGSHVAERVRNGFEVAIVGRPNVGKSTLLNRLAGREAAITSEIAGTTRDVIEVQMDLAGIPVTFIDTAGIRETSDEIEKLGVKRAKDRAKQADLRVFLHENNELPDFSPEAEDIVLLSKQDGPNDGALGISGKTGYGVERLTQHVVSILSNRVSNVGVAIRLRHREALEICEAQLAEVVTAIDASLPIDLVADDLRQAVRSVDTIVGRVDVEDLLDEIFSSFCIGK